MIRRLVAADSDFVVAERLRMAVSASGRMRGLLGRPPVQPGEGLLLTPCKQVHTFGMRYPIDVVFCERDWVVTRIVRGLQPRRLSRIDWKAQHAIELPQRAAAQLSVGDRLRVEYLDRGLVHPRVEGLLRQEQP